VYIEENITILEIIKFTLYKTTLYKIFIYISII